MRRRQYLDYLNHNPERLVACFGSAQLVRSEHGRLEVRGGTDVDRAEARLWVGRFLRKPLPAGVGNEASDG
jgi:hypothetical protein